LAKEQKKSASHLKQEIKESGKEGEIDESVVEQQEASAAKFLEFMEKARSGEMIPNDVIVRYAHYFKDDLTLDNMPRMQLINMCKCATALLSSVIRCRFH
jgi:LETM1 and EF-hand domain-containing protein 1, mitochondrial